MMHHRFQRTAVGMNAHTIAAAAVGTEGNLGQLFHTASGINLFSLFIEHNQLARRGLRTGDNGSIAGI